MIIPFDYISYLSSEARVQGDSYCYDSRRVLASGFRLEPLKDI